LLVVSALLLEKTARTHVPFWSGAYHFALDGAG
jgi:hypothetical protein